MASNVRFRRRMSSFVRKFRRMNFLDCFQARKEDQASGAAAQITQADDGSTQGVSVALIGPDVPETMVESTVPVPVPPTGLIVPHEHTEEPVPVLLTGPADEPVPDASIDVLTEDPVPDSLTGELVHEITVESALPVPLTGQIVPELPAEEELVPTEGLSNVQIVPESFTGQMLTVSVQQCQIEWIRTELDRGHMVHLKSGQSSVLVFKEMVPSNTMDAVNESACQVAAVLSELGAVRTMLVEQQVQKDEDVARLHAKINFLEKEGALLLSNFEGAKTDIICQNTMIRSELETLKTENADILVQKDREISELKAEMGTQTALLLSRLEAAESEIQEMKDEVKTLTRQLQSVSSGPDSPSLTKKAESDGTCQVAMFRSELEALRAKVIDQVQKDEEVAKLRNNVHIMEKQGSNLLSSLEAAEAKMRTYELEALGMKEEIKTLNNQLQSINLASSMDEGSTSHNSSSSENNGSAITFEREGSQLEMADLQVQKDTYIRSHGIILYTTSVTVVRKTAERCKQVRAILENSNAAFYEKDISLGLGYREELQEMLGPDAAFPCVFINGAFIGGADELERMNEDGKLQPILREFQHANGSFTCCGGVRFRICGTCEGTHRIIYGEGRVVTTVPCLECNEQGLVRCACV